MILQTAVHDNIQQRVDVVGMLDLPEIESRPQAMMDWFRRFQGMSFTPQQRLILNYYETDYYPHIDGLPNTLYNALSCLSWFDISTDHVIILSTGGIGDLIDQHCGVLNITSPKVIITHLWCDYPDTFDDVVSPIPNKQYVYSCLNGVPRTHRQTVLSMLIDRGLEDQGIITWNPNYTREVAASNQMPIHNDHDTGPPLRLTQPWSRINEELSLCPQTKKLHIKMQHELSRARKHHLVTGNVNDRSTWWSADFLQHSLVYVITETVGEYPHPFFSEKTWRAMYSLMPFMMVGAKNSLAELQNLGFETFNDIWDEGYDQLSHVSLRIEAVMDILTWLCRQDLDGIFSRCLPRLERNRQRLITLREHELSEINKQLT